MTSCCTPVPTGAEQLGRFVGDDRLGNRNPVAPLTHVALLRRGAECDLALLPIESAAHEGIEPLPGAVPVVGIWEVADVSGKSLEMHGK